MRVMQAAQPQAAWGKSQVLREQRLHPRARFLNPVPVDVSCSTLASKVRVLTCGDAPKVKVYGALTGHGGRKLMGVVARFGARAIVERCSPHVREMMDVARMFGNPCVVSC